MTAARVTDVAVVGGGVLGCSAALHLKLGGCDGVTVIERDRIGAGTSGAGAGLLARWSAGFVPAWDKHELDIEAYGLDFYRALSARGNGLGYLQTGTLYLGVAGPIGPKSLLPLARHDEVEDLALRTPSEVEELTHGFVRAAGVAGGIFDRRGARIAAGPAARALARRCAELGGVIIEHEPVNSIRCGRTGGFVLETADGPVRCRKLVAAAGAWTNAILQQFGVRLPLVPLVATRLTTKPIRVPASLPAIQFCDGHRIYLREDHGSLAWGCNYEGDPRYAFVARKPPDRLDGLSDACVTEMRRAAHEVASAVPALASARLTSAVHGAPCFTADLKPVIGEITSVPGLYVLAGDNYAGVTHAPGGGRLLAELVLGVPDPSVDADPYRPERFDGQYRTGEEVIAAMRWTATQATLAARARVN
jgi:glycine/D-amino acid oxidase-like deaminating enzyme